MDMEKDPFADLAFGKAALKKLGPVSENFRLYSAGWLGTYPDFHSMRVTGAEFRKAKRGRNVGKLCILKTGTSRSTIVTKTEINAFADTK